ARAARAASEVVLEVRVSPRSGVNACEGFVGKRCASEVRVHDHTRRVDHAAELRLARRFELGAESGREIAWIGSGADLFARTREHRPRRIDRERVGDPTRQLVDGRKVAQPGHATQANAAPDSSAAGLLPISRPWPPTGSNSA